MKKTPSALFIVVSLAWNTGGILAAQPTKVRIFHSSRSNSITPFHRAVQKGFFAEEGMEVELIQANPRLE
jgi:ABC-type nitrate/sulfonate/bicarbonate transport system substrate-binding protein